MRRDVYHGQWDILLDAEFLHAYQHGNAATVLSDDSTCAYSDTLRIIRRSKHSSYTTCVDSHLRPPRIMLAVPLLAHSSPSMRSRDSQRSLRAQALTLDAAITQPPQVEQPLSPLGSPGPWHNERGRSQESTPSATSMAESSCASSLANSPPELDELVMLSFDSVSSPDFELGNDVEYDSFINK